MIVSHSTSFRNRKDYRMGIEVKTVVIFPEVVIRRGLRTAGVLVMFYLPTGWCYTNMFML